MNTYRRDFDETKYMPFLIKDDEFSKANIMKFWRKLKVVSRLIVNNEKYLKLEIKSYNGKINPNFHKNKIPREGS